MKGWLAKMRKGIGAGLRAGLQSGELAQDLMFLVGLGCLGYGGEVIAAGLGWVAMGAVLTAVAVLGPKA